MFARFLAYMNMFARFDENPAMTLQDIKETKRYGRMDNMKTVYPPKTQVCGGYKYTCLAYMNLFARFDENPAMTLQDIKETKRYGRTQARTDMILKKSLLKFSERQYIFGGRACFACVGKRTTNQHF